MHRIEGCQIPCLVMIAEGTASPESQPIFMQVKRLLAKPWNYHVKNWMKQGYAFIHRVGNNHGQAVQTVPPASTLAAGDVVRVKSREEIDSTLDAWKECKGCAFLPYMYEYCDTTQTVLIPMQRFLDERDYKVKKCKGIVLLTDVYCTGTPVFGRCDRRCLLFWRVEWLEKISG